MFDKDASGLIDMADFRSIMSSLNREEAEVEQILVDFGFHEGKERLSFDEFIQLMQALEKKILEAERELKRQEALAEPCTQDEREKYGAMLPRSGVHFLPDEKVIDFLKLLDDYRRKMEKEEKFSEAKRARLKFEDLQAKETLRLQNNMRAAQEQELLTIENAQKAQFIEFSQAWDNYMADYEATAYLSLEKLKEKHLKEIEEMREKIRRDCKIKLKLSKDLIEQRKRVKLLVGMKHYDEAEALQQKCEEQESAERETMDEQVLEMMEKSEEKLV
jgi:hypothetical protein